MNIVILMTILSVMLGITAIIILSETKMVAKVYALNPCDSVSMSYYTNSSGAYTSQHSECTQYYFPKDKSGRSDFSYSNPSQKPGNNAQDIIAANKPLLEKRPFVSAMPKSTDGKSFPSSSSLASHATSIDTSPTSGTGKYVKQKWAQFDHYLATLSPSLRKSLIQKFTLELQRQLSDVPIKDRSTIINRMKADMPPRLAQAVIPHLIQGYSTNSRIIADTTSNFPRSSGTGVATNNHDGGSSNGDSVDRILNTADQWIKRGKHVSSCGVGDLKCTISPSR
jgi:hypothetical protein